MRSHPLPWLLVLLSLLPACSLLVDFDPEGQPCGGAPDGSVALCSTGYVCSGNVCVPSTNADGGTLPDGGTGGSSLCEDPAGCPELPPGLR